MLLHGLEKRALRLWGCAVDLVGEHDVREDGAMLKREPAAGIGLADHHGAGDVRGHQIWRELNARELQGQRVADGADERSLAKPRDALEKHVATGEQRGDDVAHQLLLAHDELVQLRLERASHGGEVVGRGLLDGWGDAHPPRPCSDAKYSRTRSRSPGANPLRSRVCSTNAWNCSNTDDSAWVGTFWPEASWKLCGSPNG